MNVKQILSLDLEITKDRKKLLHLGAVLGDESLDIHHNYHLSIHKLNKLVGKAEFILGHNILNHDLPWLMYQEKLFTDQNGRAEQASDATSVIGTLPAVGTLPAISTLPVIDTLFLSPLAFPENPYHRLVKDYKIIKDSYNNPVADACLALIVFTEQLEAFKQQYHSNPDLTHLVSNIFHLAMLLLLIPYDCFKAF